MGHGYVLDLALTSRHESIISGKAICQRLSHIAKKDTKRVSLCSFGLNACESRIEMSSGRAGESGDALEGK